MENKVLSLIKDGVIYNLCKGCPPSSERYVSEKDIFIERENQYMKSVIQGISLALNKGYKIHETKC